MAPFRRAQCHPIAIVGMGFRLPGDSTTPDELARFLEQHGDAVCDVPADRWSLGRFYSPNEAAPGRMYVKRAAFLRQDIFSMDPAPFNLSPRECALLDPQQRLLLESAWDALEDAGMPVTKLRGSNTGVYVGGFMQDIRDITTFPANTHLMASHTPTSVTGTILSNRLSYVFDWHGPSISVDTACSSSLVTIHLACRDLLDGACDAAVAGGVNVMLSPASMILMCKGQFLARDGRSKTFDAAADGYGRGEGAALLVLKRLEDAIRNGDRIYAQILASGVNQDGRTDGMALPNSDAQVALSRRVSDRAGIDPKRVGYVEAHGTGTRAGDLAETRALSEVYAGAGRAQPLIVGSVKTNIGHLEAGAGVAGVMKTALSLYHRKIFPVRELLTPNPEIDFVGLGIRVPLNAEDWPENTDLTAAVNSFGYGGTNGHAILSAAPEHTRGMPRVDPRGPRMICVSAFDEHALMERARQLLPLVEANPYGVASTLAHHRGHLPVRAAVLSTDPSSVAVAFRAIQEGQPHESLVKDRADVSRLCCVYTGMGPQWWGMGRELFGCEPVFRRAAERVDTLFQNASGWSLLKEMLASEPHSRLNRNFVAQPANFLLQVALTELLLHYGVKFAGYLGHSVGELTAAWASGCLSLEDATFAAFHRSDLQEQVAGRGTMLAVELSLEEAEVLCRELDDVCVAAINGARSIVLAGKRDSLKALKAELDTKETFSKFMHVDVAYHSAHMDPLAGGFVARLANLRPSEPNHPLFSTAYGIRITAPTHDGDYWWKNARMPVLLQPALHAALTEGFDGFLEVGPHPVLAGAIQGCAREVGVAVKSMSSLRRNEPQNQCFEKCLAALHCAGVELDWEKLVPSAPQVALPRYPFQRKRYWEESDAALAYRLGRPSAHPFLDQRNSGGDPEWEVELDDTRFDWLSGHQVQGARVFPAAGYLEIAFAVSAELFGDHEHVLSDAEFLKGLVVVEGEPAKLVVRYAGDQVIIGSKLNGGSVTHARIQLAPRSRYLRPNRLDIQALLAEAESCEVDVFYQDLGDIGLNYTGSFRGIQRLWQGHGGVSIAEIMAVSQPAYWVFPALLDAAFQALFALLRGGQDSPVIPVRAGTVRCFRRASGSLYAVCRRIQTPGQLVFDVDLCEPSGELVARVEDLVLEPIGRSQELRGSELAWLHGKEWVLAPPVVPLHVVQPLCVVGPDSETVDWAIVQLESVGQPAAAKIPEGASEVHVVFVGSRKDEADLHTELWALIRCVQTLASRGASRLTVLTHGAHSLHGEATRPPSGALLGFTRVAMTEHPELATKVLDLPLSVDIRALDLKQAILSRDEEECALRDGIRHALRIVRVPPIFEARRAERRLSHPGEPCELFVERPGAVNSVIFRPRHFGMALAPNEVEVEVEHASLNFKDLMKATGLLHKAAMHRTYLGTELGVEASGRVLRVGTSVSSVAAGQRVIVFVGGALATRLRVTEDFVVPSDPALDGSVAASFLVYATALHALVDRAQLAAGETVLIHSATSAVGLAAIQIAQSRGARILATAGTLGKRQYLAALGVSHIYDSKTLDYATQVRRATGGSGVDVVLNSLSGEHLQKSVELLAPGGRFVELGKQDFAENRKLGLSVFSRAISFLAVDLDRMSLEAPKFFKPLAQRVCAAFQDGTLHPLPTQMFSAHRAADAFRELANEERIGKVILDFSEGVGDVAPGLAPRPEISRDGTYLVVGGLGGFGLRTAEWLADCGAGALVLASRRGEPSSADRERVLRLVARLDCDVRCESLDVADSSAIRTLVERLSALDKPLRGVFHAAALLVDEPIRQITEESLRSVLGAKAVGAWNLHLATAHLPLDHFVLYSSVAGWIGNPGQGAYAAANGFLDALAHLRKANGLAATSIGWGAIGDVGMVARDEAVGAHLQRIGFSSMLSSRVLEALRGALKEGQVDHGIVDADWNRWVRSAPDTSWRRLERVLRQDSSANSQIEELVRRLGALNAQDRMEFVQARLKAVVAPIFKVEVERFEIELPLRNLGMDSLIALELQAEIEVQLGVEVSTMELLAGRSVAALAALVLQRVLALATPEVTPTADADAVPVRLSGVPGNLRQHFLERICVQPPYFALEEVLQEGDWLTARVKPAEVPTNGSSAQGLAEAARHMAILGSCALRVVHGNASGRIYYPVKEARLREWVGLALPGEVVVRAKPIHFDPKGSVGSAETILCSQGGEVLCRFDVTYHVIPEEEFKVLFAQHARPTHEGLGDDPYREFPHQEPAAVGIGRASLTLAPIEQARCLGHFVGYPAYPVSIMVRDIFHLVDAAITFENGAEGSWTIIAGGCFTSRFVFAGEIPELTVAREGAMAGVEQWRADLKVGTELAAWFEMSVRTSGAQASSQGTDLVRSG
ncbi:MAG: SDR family NAD(P)-dependent oxidoreductase [Polyangiaceae bacterium]|nr:SDR family NAD(P)-dependent oxidoreductase [Polyangiaceae bacterium]